MALQAAFDRILAILRQRYAGLAPALLWRRSSMGWQDEHAGEDRDGEKASHVRLPKLSGNATIWWRDRQLAQAARRYFVRNSLANAWSRRPAIASRRSSISRW